MSSQRHQEHLNSYLKSKKSSPAKSTRPPSSPSRAPFGNQGTSSPKSLSKSSGTQKCKSEKQSTAAYLRTKSVQKHVSRLNTTKTIDNINRLPEELLFKIFSFLSFSELLISAQVCCRWSALIKDRSLWYDVFRHLPQEIRKLFSVEETKQENFDWKKEIIKRSICARNSKFLASSKKVNPYTGLQAGVKDIIKNLCIRWKVCFTDTRGQDHWSTSNESNCFNCSVSIRWLSLQLPSLSQLKSMKVFAGVPVFFDKAWKPHKKSATTYSLLKSFDLKEKGRSTLSKEKADVESDMITVHFGYPELLIACWTSSWKDGGEIAFVTASLHFDGLLKRMLSGSYSRIYQAPKHKPFLDDIDSQYGLHGYSAMVEIRNHVASYWSHQFRDLNYSDMTSEYIVLRDFPNGSFSKKVTLPWKTELFRNILQDTCFLDFTVLDEHKRPLWCKSSAVKVNKNEKTDVNYSSEGECFYIVYCDDKGTLRIDMNRDENEDQTRVIAVEFLLSKSFVNLWFGRSY